MFSVAAAVGRRGGDGSAGVLGQHRVEHLRNELLLRPRKLTDGLDLLLEARAGSALAGRPGGRLTDQQLLDRQVEHLGQDRQLRSGDASPADFVVGQRLLGDAQMLGELDLGY